MFIDKNEVIVLFLQNNRNAAAQSNYVSTFDAATAIN